MGDAFEGMLGLAFLGFPLYMEARESIEAGVKCIHASNKGGNVARYELISTYFGMAVMLEKDMRNCPTV